MKFFSSLAFVFLCSSAKAGLLGNSFFIEPFVGYRNESITLVDLSSTTSQIKTSSPAYGLKVGYRSLLGIDFNLSGDISSGQAEVSNITDKNNFSHKSASFELGVNSFGLIKMYLGTSLFNEFKVEDSPSLTGFNLAGPSYFVGLQLKMLAFLNLGLQYNLNQYNEITGPNYNNGSKVETYYTKVDTQQYTAYLSLPF